MLRHDNGRCSAGIGGKGGAAVHLKALEKLTVNTINVDGKDGEGRCNFYHYGTHTQSGYHYYSHVTHWSGGGGGGAGGSILLEADSIQITGTLTANGGQGSWPTQLQYHPHHTNPSDPFRGLVNYHGEGGCGGGGRISMICTKKWDGKSSTSTNWNALKTVNEPESTGSMYKLSFSKRNHVNADATYSTVSHVHPRPGGPGTIYYDCGNRRQELVVDYKPFQFDQRPPVQPSNTVIAADDVHGEVHLRTLITKNGATVTLGPQHLIAEHSGRVVRKRIMMMTHIGRFLSVGEHGTARRNLLQVSTGNVVFLRQTNTGTKPFRVSYDISPSARWQTLEQNPNDGSITGAHSARSVVGTETCSKSNSLSGGWCDTLTEKNQGDTTYCELSKQSSSQTPFRWKHKYPPITKPITKVTLTIDCKDCDSGTIGLRSILDTGGSGIVLGTITGATNGNALISM